MTASVDVFGTCGADPVTIIGLADRGDYPGLVTLPGRFALVIRRAGRTLLVASAFGPANLFYLDRPGAEVFGTRVLDVAERSGIAWRWNWRALADLSALEHCVGEDTLHADIKKVGPGTVVRFDVDRIETWQMSWEERTRCKAPSARAAVDALVESCSRYAGDDPVVSMSAGFDSRLLLACLLASGIKPRLITMGSPASTDAQVSMAIARRFGLQLAAVELRPREYLRAGEAIVEVTAGTKTLLNWHTYLYARNARLAPGAALFIGSNGEAARTYYLDKGLAAVAAGMFGAPLAKRAFWQRKLRPIFRREELDLLHPDLRRQFSGRLLADRVERLCALTPGPLLSGLDTFYTEQRVAHFITAGLALVGEHARPIAPMLEHAWMSQVWNLPRHWKLDCLWHRFAIRHLCVGLLDFPEERTGEAMRPGATTMYWLRRRASRSVVPYVNYHSMLSDRRLGAFMRRKSPVLGGLADRELLPQILERHATGYSRVRPASFLLTLAQLVRVLGARAIEISDEFVPGFVTPAAARSSAGMRTTGAFSIRPSR